MVNLNCNKFNSINKELEENKIALVHYQKAYTVWKNIFDITSRTGYATVRYDNGQWQTKTLDDVLAELDKLKWSGSSITTVKDRIKNYKTELIAQANYQLAEGSIENPGLIIGGIAAPVGVISILGTAPVATNPVTGAMMFGVGATPPVALAAGIGLFLSSVGFFLWSTFNNIAPTYYDPLPGKLMLQTQKDMYDTQKAVRKLTKQRDELLANCTFTGICPSKSDELQIQYFDPSTITTSANKLGRKAVPNDLVDDRRIVAKETEIAQKLKDMITLQEEKSKLLAVIQSVSSALDSLQLTRDEILECDQAVGGILDEAGVTKENTGRQLYFKGRSNMTAYCAMKKYAAKAASAISSIRSIKTDHFKVTELKNKADNIKNAANKIANDIFTHSRQIESINDLRFDCVNTMPGLSKRCSIYRILPGGGRKTVGLPQGWGNFYAALIGAASNLGNEALFPVTSIPDTHNTFKQKTLKLLEDLKPGNLDTKIAALQSEINDLDIEIENYTEQNTDAWEQYLSNEVKAYFGSGNTKLIGKWFVTAPSTNAIKNKGGSPFQSKSAIFAGAKSNRVYYDLNPDTFMLTVRIDNSHIDRALRELSTSTDLDIIEQSMVNVDNINTIEGFTKAGAGYKIKGGVISSGGTNIPDTLKRILGDAINPLDVDVDLSSCFRSA